MNRATARKPLAPRGFTLIELIVALIIGVIVTGATTAIVRQFSRAKSRAVARQEAFARASAGADRIASDIELFVRDEELTFAKVSIQDGGDATNGADSLLLVTRSLRRVRTQSDNPEGADREVMFHVENSPDALWLRTDAPADEYLDAGGIAEPIVRGVVGLSVLASDGQSWLETWDSDRDGYPHGVQVTVTALADDGVTKATARRTVALDRTPLPVIAADSSTSGAETTRATR